MKKGLDAGKDGPYSKDMDTTQPTETLPMTERERLIAATAAAQQAFDDACRRIGKDPRRVMPSDARSDHRLVGAQERCDASHRALNDFEARAMARAMAR